MNELLEILLLLGFSCTNPQVREVAGLPYPGFTSIDREGQVIIMLRPGLNEAKREATLLHEAVHCAQWQRGDREPSMGSIQRRERQAQAVELLAVEALEFSRWPARRTKASDYGMRQR